MQQVKLICCIAVVFGLCCMAMASNSASHRVTIQVVRANEIVPGERNIVISVPPTRPESKTQSPIYSADSNFRWATSASIKKMTVTTHGTLGKYQLYVQAINCKGGISTGQILLSASDIDFITSMSTITGSCGLKYIASPLEVESTESEIHTVIYTITDTF